jgi:polysaccharide chain length determinant protein (PEP-CTERM system associated)
MGNEFDHYIEVALRRKWHLAAPAVAGVVIAAVAAIGMPSYYRSTTTILVEQQRVPERYVMPTDSTPFSQRLNTIRQQILSRPRLESIIQQFNLYQSTSSMGPVSALRGRLGLKSKKPPLKEDIIERMTDDIDINLIGGRTSGDAFSVSYAATDPYVAMQVTGAIASMFIEENLRVREQYAEGTSDFLASELENAKKDLEKQELSVKNYKERYMGGLPQQLDANLRTLDRLQMELQTVNIELRNSQDRGMLMEAQMKAAGAASGVASGAVAGATQPNALADELARLNQELAALLSIYKDTYPDVIMTRRRIAEVKGLLTRAAEAAEKNRQTASTEEAAPVAAIDPELYNNLAAVKAQMASLREREAEIREQMAVFERRVEQTPANEQRLSDLRRDYEVSLQNYQALLEKRFNARLAENLEKRQKGERFTVIDPANLPEKPFKPSRPAVTMAGAAVGVGLGVGLVIILEFLNPAFRKPEELAGLVPYQVLAAIPDFTSASAKRTVKRLRLVKGSADNA